MDHGKVRRSLEQRLEQLTARLAEIDSELRNPGSKDSEDRITELENHEVLEGLGDAEREEIRGIRRALDRIAEGTYGSCSECGKQIGAPRLEALPFTTVCIACAS